MAASGFSIEKIIETDRETVYETLSGYENYQRLVPRHFPSVRVRSVRGNVAVVEEHMNLGGRELVIMAKHVLDRPVMHEVFVIGGDARGSYIRQRFFDVPKDGTTRVVVDVDLKLGGMMMMMMSNFLFGRNNFKLGYEAILDDLLDAAAATRRD